MNRRYVLPAADVRRCRAEIPVREKEKIERLVLRFNSYKVIELYYNLLLQSTL